MNQQEQEKIQRRVGAFQDMLAVIFAPLKVKTELVLSVTKNGYDFSILLYGKNGDKQISAFLSYGDLMQHDDYLSHIFNEAERELTKHFIHLGVKTLMV